jgi:anti-sigma B factor antagonist
VVGVSGDKQLGAGDDHLLRIRVEPEPDCVIVHVDGEIDYGTAGRLGEEAASAVQTARNPRLVLDLGDVTFCDSSGLAVLVGIWRTVQAMGGRLVLARVPQRCRVLLTRTGLAKIFTFRDRLAEAITTVSSNGRPNGGPYVVRS